MHLFLHAAAWLIALTWLALALAAARGLPRIPNLLRSQYDLPATPASPRLTVIVPARNEQQDILPTLESLLGQDYPDLQILAVDDRSTDATGALITALAAAHPTRLQAISITQLPPHWLGKTHAMAIAANHAIATLAPDFLLFTDADILFRPDTLRRALAHAAHTRADHLVLFPTTIIRRWDEAALLGFFQIIGLCATRPWRASTSKSYRDAVGIGAFNLVSTSAYQHIGGFESLRMEIVEDLALGRRIKRLGLTQRVAFGRDLVRIHWAAGVPGLVQVMTKNIFAACHFSPARLFVAVAWLTLFCIAPFVAVCIPGYIAPSLLVILSLFLVYSLVRRHSGISPFNTFLAPFAAATFIYTLLRSMVVTLRQGGVLWRGTFYPLAELRRHQSNAPNTL